MDRSTIYERLEQYAKEGHVFTVLNLYNRQIENLVREGFAIQRGIPVPGWKGQYRCKLGWRYALPGTVAWHLLEVAADNNPELREELSNPPEEPLDPPYSTAWML